ncbi:MAG: hypothetical protein ABIW76_03940 [Fibrobacteria bacterium]
MQNRHRTTLLPRLGILALAGISFAAAAAAPEITIKGGAALSMGYIVKSSDTSTNDYNGNRMQSVGAQLLLQARMSGNLLISTGVGITERHFPAGNIGNAGGRTPFTWTPYLVDADFNYSWWNSGDATLNLTGGYFPYSYNPDVKNLGLYLTRGPVYPGILVSGFETKHTRPVANTLGLRLNHRSGAFEQDLVLNSETETFPIFDISPIYVATFKFGSAFRLGAGANFQHLISVDSRLTSPDTLEANGGDDAGDGNPLKRTNIYVDTIAHDTTFMSFAGTKVMAFLSFDPKAWFSSEALGAEDLKVYAEVAVLGLSTTKAYNALYGDLKNRMPIMAGFNIPAFKLLDHLSLEVEWYDSRVKDDLTRFQPSTGNFYSPIPVANEAKLDLAKDDLKWSLHAERKIGQIRVSAQVANDHSRPGGTLTSRASEWQAFFVDTKDWYWMAKVGFFF